MFEWKVEDQKIRGTANSLGFYPQEVRMSQEDKIAALNKYATVPYSYISNLHSSYLEDLANGKIKSKEETDWHGELKKVPITVSFQSWLKKHDTLKVISTMTDNSWHRYLGKCRGVYEYYFIQDDISKAPRGEYGGNIWGGKGTLVDSAFHFLLVDLANKESDWFRKNDPLTVWKLKCRDEVRKDLLGANKTLWDFVINGVPSKKITVEVLEKIYNQELNLREVEKKAAENVTTWLKTFGIED